MIKIIRAIKQDTKIVHKFIAFIIILDFIPLLLLTIAANEYFKGVVKNEALSSYEMVMNQYIGNVQYKLKGYHYMIDSIVVNNTLQDIFNEQKNYELPDTINLSVLFSNIVDNTVRENNSADIYSIKLYALNKNFPSDGKYISNLKYAEASDWFEKTRLNLDKTNWFYYHMPGNIDDVFSITKPIYDMKGNNYSKKLGFIKIDLYVRKLFKIEDQGEIEKNTDIAVVDENGDIVYGIRNNIHSDNWKDIVEIALNMQQGEQITDNQGKKYMIIRNTIEQQGLRVLFLFPYDQIESKVLQISRSMVLIEIALFIVMVAFTFTIFGHVSKRLRMLVKKIVKLGDGDLEIIDVIEGKDEIGIVDEHFNLMVSKLKASIHENYIQRIGKREAELNALQLQIKPHFLYNTLESINAIASVYRCKEISVISQKLGDMFRYSINSGESEFVPLKEEIRHIQNYIEIQKIRFDEKFNVTYSIPEELMVCRIIKFILQPIVENALLHGFEGKRGTGCLDISATIEEGGLAIKIKDDGIGISEQQLESLNAYINNMDDNDISKVDGSKRSIGLKNVNYRIKLTHGEQYGILIASGINEGTSVILLLPVHGYIKRDTYVQDSDC